MHQTGLPRNDSGRGTNIPEVLMTERNGNLDKQRCQAKRSAGALL